VRSKRHEDMCGKDSIAGGRIYTITIGAALKQLETQKSIELRFDSVALLAFQLKSKGQHFVPEIVSVPRLFLVVPALIRRDHFDRLILTAIS